MTIETIELVLSDAGNTAVSDYGSIVGPLTNGVQLSKIIRGNQTILADNVKSASDLFNFCAKPSFVELQGNSRLAVYRMEVGTYSDGIVLNGDTEDKLVFTVNDELSTLAKHSVAFTANYIDISA